MQVVVDSPPVAMVSRGALMSYFEEVKEKDEEGQSRGRAG